MSEANHDGKDILYAGLAREARTLGLPVNVLSFYIIAAGILFFGIGLAFGSPLWGGIFAGILYIVLKTLTWNDDKAVTYFSEYLTRRRKFYNKLFKGTTYDTTEKVIGKSGHFDFKKHSKDETQESNNIPYLYHVNKHIIKLKNGDLVSSIKLEGFNFETQAYDDLVRLKEVRNTLFRMLGSRAAIYVHYIRKEIPLDPVSDNLSFFPMKVMKVYYQLISKNKVMANDIYLSILIRKVNPNDPAAKRIKDALAGQVEKESVLIRDMDEAIQTITGSLQNAQPKLLMVKPFDEQKPNGLQYCEILSFLSYLTNLEVTKVPVLEARICDYLSTTRKVFRANGTIIFNKPDGETHKAAVFSVATHNYPEMTDHRMLDAFLKVPHELIITESFALMDKQKSESITKKKQTQLKQSSDSATSQIESIDDEKDNIASGRTVTGHFTFSVMTHAKTDEDFNSGIQTTRAAFAASGLIPRKEDLLAEPVFWHSLVGNKKYMVRLGIINTANFAGFASLHNTKIGRKTGNHWGSYVAELVTENNTPYYFNFHQGDVGHTSVIATTGSGKTTVLNFLLAAADKFKPKIFHFDFEYGATTFIESMGGTHTTIMTTIPTGWNPMLLPDTDENRAFLFKLFCFMGKREGIQITKDNFDFDSLVSTADSQKISDAINSIYTLPQELRKLSEVLSLFGTADEKENNLRYRLNKWAGEGAFANLFDNKADSFSLDSSRVFGFEMKHIIKNNDYLTAASMYIFHRIDQGMKGNTPFFIVIEEGQRYIENAINMHWINEMLTTYRRRNGSVIFVTPTPEIILSNPNLIQQFSTRLLFCNDQLNPDTYAQLGCTEHEINWLNQNKGAMMGKFMIKQGLDSVIVNLNLYQTPAIVSLLSGNETRAKIITNLKAIHGDSPEDWLPAYWKDLNNQRSSQGKKT